MTTFLAIAQISKLPVLSFYMTASGKLENIPEEGYRFSEIVLSSKVEVNPWHVEKARCPDKLVVRRARKVRLSF